MTPGSDPRAVVHAVRRALESSPTFRHLDPATQQDLSRSMGRISGYLDDPAGARALAEPLDGGVAPATPAPAGGPVARVGDVARSTLNAIDFPSFVSGLIKGTFQAIVDATIQQLEAYAALLREVAKTVDEYMQDNVSDDAAKDYLVDRYSGVMVKDTSGTTPTLQVNRSDPVAPLPTFFKDLGFDNAAQIDPVSVDEVIVPAARKTIAEQRHQTLATMILLGLNRIVVNDGEINAKLQFHIDASETTGITFDSTQTNIGNLAGVAGGSTFTGQGIMVNTANINAQSDLNVRADLTGEVKVHFSSDYLPAERFADSNAIQLINQHATVPVAAAPAALVGADGAPAPAPATAAPQALPPTRIPVPAPAPTGPPRDPWSPRR